MKFSKASSIFSVVTAITVLSSTAYAAPVIIVNETFEDASAVLELSGGTTEFVASAASDSFGIGDYFFRNTSILDPMTGQSDPILLSLTGLQAHDSISIAFDLVLVDSWDGNNGTANAPDIINVTFDGDVLLSEFGSNFGDPLASTAPSFSGVNAYGGDANDTGYSLSFNDISHSTSTLTLAIFASGAGYLGGADESFAIDNLVVTLNTIVDANPVPLPAAAWFMGIGIVGLAGWHKRRTA